MSGVGEEAAGIFLWRLHYGKLAAGPDRHIPATEGFGVTRRSAGLGAEDDALLSLHRVIGVRRLDSDMIDEASRGEGCLVVRADSARASILRARFRREDGDHGHGRLYQQSAVWLADASHWRRHPAALLAIAGADIQATPDALDEDEAARFGEAPLHYHIDSFDPDAVRCVVEEVVEETQWALPMLDLFAEGAESGADAALTFGAEDFESEAEFLAAAGLVLQFLTEHYPRWEDISVVSGLRHALPGLCLRYLPGAAIEMETPVAA